VGALQHRQVTDSSAASSVRSTTAL